MKKYIVGLLVACISFFCMCSNKNAYVLEGTLGKQKFDYYDVTAAEQEKETVLLCYYESGSYAVALYHDLRPIERVDETNYYILYRGLETGSTLIPLINKSKDNRASYGTFTNLFNGDRVHYQEDKRKATAEEESTFTCPAYALISEISVNDEDIKDEICLSNDSTCGDSEKYESKAIPWDSEQSSSFFWQMSDKLLAGTSEVVEYAGYEDLLNYRDTEGQYFVEKGISIAKKEIETIYEFDTKYVAPAYYQNYWNVAYGEIDQTSKDQLDKDIDNKVALLTDDYVADGMLTEEEAEAIKAIKHSQTYERVNRVITQNISSDDCKSILGGMSSIIDNIFRTVQYAGPVLVGVLTMIDFIGAAFNDDASAMNKASKKLIKRLVAAALLFFIPLLTSFLFELVGITAPSHCLNI